LLACCLRGARPRGLVLVDGTGRPMVRLSAAGLGDDAAMRGWLPPVLGTKFTCLTGLVI
jgi:hypothetical protein